MGHMLLDTHGERLDGPLSTSRWRQEPGRWLVGLMPICSSREHSSRFDPKLRNCSFHVRRVARARRAWLEARAKL